MMGLLDGGHDHYYPRASDVLVQLLPPLTW